MLKTKVIGRIIAVMAVLLLLPALLLGCGAAPPVQETAGTDTAVASTSAPASGAADLIIPVSELSQTPRFYAAEAGGNQMEVIALTAPDGSVRTAFNTCQVCYSSGRGYYEADGDELVCQNCGNRFGGDAVGVESGGCNPVPILEQDRSEKDGVITISGALLSEAGAIFADWK
jgi:uncharacterized membrane protein